MIRLGNLDGLFIEALVWMYGSEAISICLTRSRRDEAMQNYDVS
jgi:hypothetical protein